MKSGGQGQANSISFRTCAALVDDVVGELAVARTALNRVTARPITATRTGATVAVAAFIAV